MKASIIILDFKKSQRVFENVESIQKQKVDFDFEVIVAVNAADDEAREKLTPLRKYQNVKLIFNEKKSWLHTRQQ
jgi:glycosyltransferase involved in cell wall biosynthesis